VKPLDAPEAKSAVKALSAKRYQKPQLTTFGNVSKITQSVGSDALKDSFASTRMPPNMH
jgi:hypothetical protein